MYLGEMSELGMISMCVYFLCMYICPYRNIYIYIIYTHSTHGFGTQLLFWMGLTSQIMGQIKSSKTTMFQMSWSAAPHDRHIKATIRKMSTKTV